MKKKIGFEEGIVFLSNTIGSFVVALDYGNNGTVFGKVIAIFCILNIFCFGILIAKYNNEVK